MRREPNYGDSDPVNPEHETAQMIRRKMRHETRENTINVKGVGGWEKGDNIVLKN
jgi:hypothetical protein